ncbi:DUF4423 domain-containing protein [Bdellovibrio sp. GT3]|uniref:DUF4423 domain-containing protein n=1 Tax=Bdellovibrio sp. GT3 TaxID=3136282 RepID=UPI0030F2E952
MEVFNAQNYRDLVRARIENMPNRGYGQLGKLADHLDVNQTLISQVLSGKKDFTEEQGILLANFFSLNYSETSFLLQLIRKERAGSQKLKDFLEKQLEQARKEAFKVKSHVQKEKDLSPDQQAVFYSSWIYTAVHGLTAIPATQTVESIASYLGVSRARIADVTNWLIEVGLCKQVSGKIEVGPKATFIEKESPLSDKHLSNWHVKALEAMVEKQEDDFFFSAPMTLSKEDYFELRKELVLQISKISKRVEKSESQILVAFNMDLFKV